MTDRKIIAFIFIILLFFTPLASANNDNIIFLKVGHIDTDLKTDTTIIEPDRVAVEINSEAADSSEKYYLVQFDGIVQPEWKDAAESAGATILDYVPDNTFVLKMNETVRLQVESLEFVHWVGEYLPEYKYVEEAVISTNSLEPESAETIDLVVYLFEPDDNGQVKSGIEVLGGIILDESDEMLWIRIGEDRVGELTQISSVGWIEESQELTVSNNVASEILNVDTVQNTLSLKGNNQIVAVCDIGLDNGVNDDSIHDDIQGRILRIFDYSGDGAEDTTGHGTHVTGSVLGNGSLSAGEYAGMAPEAELIFQAIGGDDGDIVPPYSSISNIFLDAYNAGARIHTNSWGSDTDGLYEGYSFYLDKFAWEHPDMLILFSVGNEGEDMDDNGVVDRKSINSPATAKNCLAVGASETDRGNTFSIGSYSTWGTRWPSNFSVDPIKTDYIGDDSEGIAAFSSRGPTNDSRIKPDIVAPGTFIISTQASTSTAWYDWDTASTGQYYAYMGGTSMSTPLVAGSAVLVREYYNDIENVANPSAALLKATLLNGAYDLTPGQYGEGEDQEVIGRPDYSQGWGRLDVENSIMAEYPEVVAYYDGDSLNTGGSLSYPFDYFESGNPLRATLVWTDYPGEVYSGKNLMNDLDLTITGPSDTYYGNGGSGPDRINNVEGIELNSVSDGEYRFNVSAHNVPHGPQPFALVASFTCDNNEYPAPDTQADSKNTAVSTDVVHPQGVDAGSVVMKINDVSVSFDSVPVTDGYNIEYNNPSSYQTGEYNVSVTATTENGLEFSYSWNFTVDAEASNNAPVLSLIENQEITETYPLTIELSAEDDDGDTLTFGTNASFGVLNDDTFTWTPGFDDEGIYYVKFNVTDDIDVDSETITITVTNLDRAPELESIGNKTVNENSSLSFTLSGTDKDGDDVTYSANGLPENAILDTGSGDFNWTPQYNESGIYNVEFVAWANGLNDSEVINITVLNVDRAPELADIGNKEIDENESLTFTISATDSDEEETTITYSANNIPEGAILDSDTGIFSWTPFYNQSGVHNIEFVATSNDLNDSQTIAIKVNNVDRAPVFDTIAGQTVNENSTLTFNVSAIDPDGDDVAYSSDNNPSDSVLDSDSGEFTWTPDFNDEGTHIVRFEATSNSLNTTTDVTIMVVNTDREPVLDPINDRSVNENTTLEFTTTANDPDGDEVSYSVNDLPPGATFSSSGDFSWTPGYGMSGSYNVEFTASSNGLDDSETITIYVGDVDRPPVLDSIDDKTVNENSYIEFTISAADPDADDVISYSIEGKPEDADFYPETRQFTWTPDYNDSGSYDVKFIASSNDFNDSENITITVLNVDRPVELDPVDDVTISESEIINFMLIGNDPDDDDIAYSASNLPGNSSLDYESGEFTWVTGYNDSDTYEIEFTATANDKTDLESMLITVNNVDRKPVLATIGTKTVNENTTLEFEISATDPDGDLVSYSVTGLPEGSLFDIETRAFEWITGYTDSGDYNVNFSAVSNGLTDYENVSIHVLNVNAPPVFQPVSPRTVQVSRNLQFNLNATDIDDNPLTYSADSLPDGAGFNTTDLLFNWTPLVNQTGIHYANFTVNDSQYYDYLNVSITVTNATTSAVTVSSAAGGGGGGGGGGGTTGEEFENIAVKDASSVFVGTGPVIFEFNRDGDDIEYVGYDSLKNAGTISVTIEVLLDKSTFVNSLPSGVVYKNINIWVGKTGYAIEENIDDPYIGFRVDRDWIEGNNIDPDSIALNRYDGGWGKLSTWQTDSDDNYLYFEASTPGFSPFAITGETQATGTNNDVSDTQFSPADSELESNVTAKKTEPENILNGFSGLISCLILTFVCFLYRKQ